MKTKKHFQISLSIIALVLLQNEPISVAFAFASNLYTKPSGLMLFLKTFFVIGVPSKQESFLTQMSTFGAALND